MNLGNPLWSKGFRDIRMGKQGSLEVVDFEDSVAQFQSFNIDGFNFCLIKYAERLSLSLSLILSWCCAEYDVLAHTLL